MKVLILASGLTANQINDIDLSDTTIVAVNHGHIVTDKWKYWVKSRDYAGNRPLEFRSDQVDVEEYDSALNEYGGHLQCGYSIVLCASYWALHNLKPNEIYYLGCDMNYTPSSAGYTHVYGVGLDIQKGKGSDPDQMAMRWKSPDQTAEEYLKEVYLRFKSVAAENNCSVWNAADIAINETRLPYPHRRLNEKDISHSTDDAVSSS